MHKKTTQQKDYIWLFKYIYYLITLVSFYFVWVDFYILKYNPEYFHPKAILLCIVLYYCLLKIFNSVYDSFDIGVARVSMLVYGQSLSELFCTFFAYFAATLIQNTLVNPTMLIVLLVFQAIFNIVWTIFVNKYYYKHHSHKKTVIVCDDKKELYKLDLIRYFDAHFEVIKQIECPDTPSEFDNAIPQETEIIFIVGVDSSKHNALLQYAILRNIVVYISPNLGDIIMREGKIYKGIYVPMEEVKKAVYSNQYLLFKRLFDIFASSMALILLSPVMFVTAVLIKAYDRGPVLYKQTRLTKNGKEFTLLKFRSMRIDAEKDGVARLSTENDDRITPIGAMIRACRLDELPQLINILKGDMSIVGPRPERPEIAKQYEETLPEFKLRLQVKAGLTGYAQVYGRYDTTPYDKLCMDLIYIGQASAVEDLSIILSTIKILFLKESTTGIKNGTTIANG